MHGTHRVVNTVVVPLDGSGYAERALGPAKVLAARLGVGVGVVKVIGAGREADRDDYLADIARAHGLEWHHIEVADDAAAAIHAVAVARDGVVCMATHGHGRATAVFGSTAEAVLAASAEPVVVVGRGVDTTRVASIDRIVVALDGTAESETVCAPAIRWAREYGLVVNLITVAAEPLTSLTEDEEGHRTFGPQNPDAYIAAAVQRHRTEGVNVVGEVLIDPISPASGLGQLLRDVPHAVLAMTTHGRTGAQRIVHGSVAGNIVDVSPMPVVMFGLVH